MILAEKPCLAGQFTQFECVNCSVIFGLPVGFESYRRMDAKTFYCPHGHRMSWAETEADKLRRERDLLKQQNARLDEEAAAAKIAAAVAEAQRARAVKEATNLKRRAKNGTCPCCSRTFVELQRHMKTKHPEFKAN